MTEISGADLTGVQIADVSLTGARVRDVEIGRASFWKVRLRSAWIGEVSIDGRSPAYGSTVWTSDR